MEEEVEAQNFLFVEGFVCVLVCLFVFFGVRGQTTTRKTKLKTM